MAGFLLVNKVYSPQYVLWLLPLAALARPRWRDQLIWQGGEVFYFAAVWWYLGGYLAPAGGADAGFYWVAIVCGCWPSCTWSRSWRATSGDPSTTRCATSDASRWALR